MSTTEVDMDMIIRLSDQIFVVFFLSFWFLFPIGLFISVSQVDKNVVHEIDLNVVRKEEDGGGKTKVKLNPTARPQGIQRPHTV